MSELLTTMLRRPYVFLFLASYLFLGQRLFGWRRTILWLVSGYLIAWLSEFSSIHNGFPYGQYHYIYENMPGELMIAGVPFFDSLSYSFLTFAGYSTAVFMIGRERAGGFLAASLGALLTMLLDVIIDPLSHIGDQWFLGRIYYYPDPGWYFDVPMSNFGGWLLVAFVIIGGNLLAWRAFPRLFGPKSQLPGPGPSWLYPLFYSGIALFIIAVTLWLGQWLMGLASSAILAAVMAATIIQRRRKISSFS